MLLSPKIQPLKSCDCFEGFSLATATLGMFFTEPQSQIQQNGAFSGFSGSQGFGLPHQAHSDVPAQAVIPAQPVVARPPDMSSAADHQEGSGSRMPTPQQALGAGSIAEPAIAVEALPLPHKSIHKPDHMPTAHQEPELVGNVAEKPAHREELDQNLAEASPAELQKAFMEHATTTLTARLGGGGQAEGTTDRELPAQSALLESGPKAAPMVMTPEMKAAIEGAIRAVFMTFDFQSTLSGSAEKAATTKPTVLKPGPAEPLDSAARGSLAKLDTREADEQLPPSGSRETVTSNAGADTPSFPKKSAQADSSLPSSSLGWKDQQKPKDPSVLPANASTAVKGSSTPAKETATPTGNPLSSTSKPSLPAVTTSRKGKELSSQPGKQTASTNPFKNFGMINQQVVASPGNQTASSGGNLFRKIGMTSPEAVASPGKQKASPGGNPFKNLGITSQQAVASSGSKKKRFNQSAKKGEGARGQRDQARQRDQRPSPYPEGNSRHQSDRNHPSKPKNSPAGRPTTPIAGGAALGHHPIPPASPLAGAVAPNQAMLQRRFGDPAALQQRRFWDPPDSPQQRMVGTPSVSPQNQGLRDPPAFQHQTRFGDPPILQQHGGLQQSSMLIDTPEAEGEKDPSWRVECASPNLFQTVELLGSVTVCCLDNL